MEPNTSLSFNYSFTRGPSNRLNIDYVAAAKSFQSLPFPIIDAHSHIHGRVATKIYLDAAKLYGVQQTYSMSQIEEVPHVREVAGDCVRFICMPSFSAKDRLHAHGEGYKSLIGTFITHGAKVVKFWNAPRIYEWSSEPYVTNPFRLNSPLHYDVMRYSEQQGMIFMTHIGDPDTWFATRYSDANKYGTKRQQYEDLEEVLSKFTRPWIGAHMLGYPEDLTFLSGLMSRYPHLYLDCSATKWIVRELSKHSREDLLAFFTQWQDRILFGSDIFTSDSHLSSGENRSEMHAKASSQDEAFALYVSRYWALRTLFETDYQGESPIADPDLAMVDPNEFGPNDAPPMRGFSFPLELLKKLYYDNSKGLLTDPT